jgi:hypothetical protein
MAIKNEEEALIRSFVIRSKQNRFLEMLANPKRRAEATAQLAHFAWLDPRWIVPIENRMQHPPLINQILRSRGAGDTCYILSECSSLDRTHGPLLTTLQEIVDYGMGTLLSCVSGQLGYFEGEGPSDRCILFRRLRSGDSD